MCVCVCVCVCLWQGSESESIKGETKGVATCETCDGNKNLVLGRRDGSTKRGVGKKREDGGEIKEGGFRPGPCYATMPPPSLSPPGRVHKLLAPPSSSL